MIHYHRGDLEIPNFIDKWPKNQEIQSLIDFPSNKTVTNRPGRGRRPTADNGIFSRALLFCFLAQNWCRDPQKAKKWLNYKKKFKVALDYIENWIFLLVYANNNHKKEYKEKVLSLTKIDFKNSMPRRSFSKVAKSSLTSILSIIKPYFDPQITYLLFIWWISMARNS